MQAEQLAQQTKGAAGDSGGAVEKYDYILHDVFTGHPSLSIYGSRNAAILPCSETSNECAAITTLTQRNIFARGNYFALLITCALPLLFVR